MYESDIKDVEVSNSRDSSTCITIYPFPHAPTPFEASVSDYILRIAKKYGHRGVTIKIRIAPRIVLTKLNF